MGGTGSVMTSLLQLSVDTRPSFLRTMTNRRPKGKKKTSKPKGTTQSTSSTFKLTIPARPIAVQADTQLSVASDSVAATTGPTTPAVEPPKAMSPRFHTPPAAPESEDDIVITPRPKTPPLPSIGAKKVFNLDILSIDDSDDGENEISPVPVQKISKAKLKAAAKAELEEKWQRKIHVRDMCVVILTGIIATFAGIILLIPQSSGSSDRRKTLANSVTYQDALSIIHETIGCEDVRRKPELSYKLSDSSQKATPVGLGCDDDWAGLCEEVFDRQKKKKTSIPVSIIVTEQVCTMLLPWSIVTWQPLILASSI